MQADNDSLNLDITVRVGCSLTYEVTGSASLVLNLKLAPDPRRSVLFEALALGNDLPSETFEDSHGNRVSRVTLQPSTNCFRHDAIVAVSSKPDNFGLVPGEPETAVVRAAASRRRRRDPHPNFRPTLGEGR